MFQVLLFISLESVERHFGGQLAAWNTNPTFSYTFFRFYEWLMTQKHAERLQEYQSRHLHWSSQRRPTCAPPQPRGQTVWIVLTEQEALQLWLTSLSEVRGHIFHEGHCVEALNVDYVFTGFCQMKHPRKNNKRGAKIWACRTRHHGAQWFIIQRHWCETCTRN